MRTQQVAARQDFHRRRLFPHTSQVVQGQSLYGIDQLNAFSVQRQHERRLFPVQEQQPKNALVLDRLPRSTNELAAVRDARVDIGITHLEHTVADFQTTSRQE